MSVMNIKIRLLSSAELPEALDLCRKVFLEFDAPDYPPEGTENFLAFLAQDQMERMTTSRRLAFVGAYQKGELIGTGAVREGRHICLLFVKREYHRHGVGSALLDALLSLCRGAGADAITVNASPYGVSFYSARKFFPLSDEKCQDGIRFVPMERKL